MTCVVRLSRLYCIATGIELERDEKVQPIVLVKPTLLTPCVCILLLAQ
jgi:hypothetical protein